jgi:type II secretory pathway pseudopilin PulG
VTTRYFSPALRHSGSPAPIEKGTAHAPARPALGAESGVIFIWVAVSFFVLAVLLVAAVQPASILAKREKEKELLFRGEAYVEAIRLFQTEHGGAYPTKLKQLIEMGPKKHRYIRRLYGNPFDPEGKWILLGPGTTVVKKDESGKTVYTSSGMPTKGLTTGVAGPGTSTPPSAAAGGAGEKGVGAGGIGKPSAPGQVLPFRIGSQEGQPIMGVFCKYHEQAFQDLKGKLYYDEWFFSPLVMPPPLPPGVRQAPRPPGGTPANKPPGL